MPTKKQVETTELRAAVVERHGDRCVICNKGPLQRSGLHLHYDSRAHLEHLPMCKECCAAAKGKNFEDYLRKMARKHARAYDRVFDIMALYYPKTGIPMPKAFSNM